MWSLSRIAVLSVLIALFYWGTAGVGDAAITAILDFMFAPYVEYFEFYLAPIMPGWGHPVVVFILIALIVMWIPALLSLSRFVACAVIALCIVKAWFAATASANVSAPPPALLTFAGFSVGWLLVSSVILERGLRRPAN